MGIWSVKFGFVQKAAIKSSKAELRAVNINHFGATTFVTWNQIYLFNFISIYLQIFNTKNTHFIEYKLNGYNWNVFILQIVAELLNHKEKQRGCSLLDANKHTHIYIKYIYSIYIYVWCIVYIIYLFETIVSKAWPSLSVFY